MKAGGRKAPKCRDNNSKAQDISMYVNNVDFHFEIVRTGNES